MRFNGLGMQQPRGLAASDLVLLLLCKWPILFLLFLAIDGFYFIVPLTFTQHHKLGWTCDCVVVDIKYKSFYSKSTSGAIIRDSLCAGPLQYRQGSRVKQSVSKSKILSSVSKESHLTYKSLTNESVHRMISPHG